MERKIQYVLLLLLFVAVFFALKMFIPKVAYINSALLFEEFKGKKDLEARLKKKESEAKLEIDSLQMRLYSTNQQFIQNKSNTQLRDSLVTAKGLYDEKKEQFKKAFSNEIQQYNDQVWKQINQYVADYGAKYGYDYILGNAETGSLMYAKSANDITKDVLIFINKKYDGQ